MTFFTPFYNAFPGGFGRGQGRGRGRWNLPPYAQGPPIYQQQFPSLLQGNYKVAVATEGPGGLDDIVSARFGRCPTFTVLTIENGNIKDVRVIQNQAAFAPQGAGISSIQLLANEGVRFIIAGNFGPNVSQVAAQLGIQMIPVPPGIRVREAIQNLVNKPI